MKTMKKLPSPQRLRALEIIGYGGEMVPSTFAEQMWPRSEGWDNNTKCGPKGMTRGGGMNLSAGGFLAKLLQAGLLLRRTANDGTNQHYYRISARGEKLLEKYGD